MKFATVFAIWILISTLASTDSHGYYGYVQLGFDIDGEAEGDVSGWSVSMSSDGTVVAIGAPHNDGNGFQSGQVRIYEYDSELSSWIQRGSDIDGEEEGDKSGETVSMSSDGTVVAIGARDNDGNGDQSGHVRVYAYDTDGDGVGNNVDTDDDGDGIADTLDAYPTDASRVYLEAPAITPESKEFSDSISSVTMSTDSENTEIRYTLDGSDPNSVSTLYENPIMLTESTIVRAKVFKGMYPGPTATVEYTKQPPLFAAYIGAYEVGAKYGSSDNPDGDWAPNLLEFAVGDVPDSGDSVPKAPEFLFNEEGKIVVKIHRLAKPIGVTLSVEKSTNLIDWVPLETSVSIDSETFMEFVSTEVITIYPCFLRIKASMD